MMTIEAKHSIYKAISKNLAAKELFKDYDHYIAYCEYIYENDLKETLFKGVFLHFCEVAFGEKY